jgi:hypothetical protein
VARRLRTETLVPLLWQCYRHVPDANGDNAQRLICREALQRRMTASIEGLAFFDFLEEQHWPDLEKRVFTRPPTQFGWIARPALYVKAQTTNRPSLDTLLNELQGSLPASDWQALQQPWTPDMVRQAAALLGQKTQAEKVLRVWEEARTLLWVNRRQEQQQVAVSVVRFENEAGARAYYGFANDLQRKRDELKDAPCAGMLRVLDSRFSALQLRPASEAVRCDKQLQLDPKSPPLSEKKILARAGEVVVEIAWYGLEADAAWAEQLLAGLVR